MGDDEHSRFGHGGSLELVLPCLVLQGYALLLLM